jgi:hypothetical protein
MHVMLTLEISIKNSFITLPSWMRARETPRLFKDLTRLTHPTSMQLALQGEGILYLLKKHGI